MRIAVSYKKCTGCRLCEMVCSLHQLDIINPEKSAIRIQKDDLDSSSNTPVVCRRCHAMKCLAEEDVAEGSAQRRFLWPGRRAEQCPFGSLGVLGQHASHCDVCAGDPQCVRVCTSGALRVKMTQPEE